MGRIGSLAGGEGEGGGARARGVGEGDERAETTVTTSVDFPGRRLHSKPLIPCEITLLL